MGTTATTSLLGLGFWLIAARVLPAADVGRAAALVSAMLLVAVVTNLGVGQVFVSRLASRADGREWSLTVSVGLLLAALASLLGGLLVTAVVLGLAPGLEDDLGAGALALLPLGVAAIACSLVLDFACIAERQAKPAFVRNAVAALVRLGLIAGAAFGPLDSAAWLVAIWVFSFLLIDAHGVVRTLPALGHDFRPTLSGWRRELAKMVRPIAGHQTINLGSQASAYLLPVIVSIQLGPTENAYFYATFMLSTGLFFIAPAIGNSLFAEGVRHPDELRRDVRRSARYILLLGTPTALSLLLLGPALLGLFGTDYADAGTGLLYVLIGSALLDAGYQLAIAVLRTHGWLREAAAATWSLLASGMAAAWLLLPPLGLIGAGVGWSIGKLAGLLVALVLLARKTRPTVRDVVAS